MIEPGDRVAIEYVGRFEDGTVFGTSRHAVAAAHGLAAAKERDRDGYGPLAFTVGDGEVIEGLDDAVRGLSVGAETTAVVPPEAAYGAVREDRRREYDREAFEAMISTTNSPGGRSCSRSGLSTTGRVATLPAPVRADTVGYNRVKIFDTLGCRNPSGDDSRQYEAAGRGPATVRLLSHRFPCS
jgi:peptidyl-prolyl cis-trans isomerase B (cyclophilin B)